MAASNPAEFHRTISEQLNARLSESPRFFWAVVVVATGYGYALWNYPRCTVGPYQNLALVLMSLVAFGVAALAEWYIAALSYGYRVLQAIQIAVEKDLAWNKFPLKRGEPTGNPFWLLPSIYWPPLAAFFGLTLLVAIGSSKALGPLSAWIGIPVAIVACYLPNKLYLREFRRKKEEKKAGSG